MRIAQMHRSLGAGGIEAMVCSLSNELAKEHDVTVCTIITPSPGDKFYRELVPEIKRDTIGRKGEGRPFKEIFRIARFVRKGKFDLVHIHGFFYYYVLAILLYHRKTCFCYTIHSNALKENNPWDLRILRIKRFCFRKGWLHPITISPTSQESFSELYGCDSKMIPNGVARPVPSGESKLDSYRITPATKVFLHASRISPEKNQLMLCRVFDRLVREGKDVVLAVAGPIHHHEIFDQMKVYFNDRIHYIDVRSDIPELLCSADGMCLTSFYEGLPVILLESLSAGCIPLCTPVGGIPDVVEDGKNGFLSEDVSEESYYSATNRFLSLPESQFEAMKDFCRKSAMLYDIAHTARLYAQYYQELLDRRV